MCIAAATLRWRTHHQISESGSSSCSCSWEHASIPATHALTSRPSALHLAAALAFPPTHHGMPTRSRVLGCRRTHPAFTQGNRGRRATPSWPIEAFHTKGGRNLSSPTEHIHQPFQWRSHTQRSPCPPAESCTSARGGLSRVDQGHGMTGCALHPTRTPRFH